LHSGWLAVLQASVGGSTRAVVGGVLLGLLVPEAQLISRRYERGPMILTSNQIREIQAGVPEGEPPIGA